MRSLTRTVNHPKQWGRLHLVDASNVKLPAFMSDWGYVTQHRNGVKMHVRLVVADSDTVYPDQLLPSTGPVSDYEGADVLVTDPDATYVMDRGYVSYKRMDRWIENGLSFVMRINDHHQANLIEERALPADSSIVTDSVVQMGSAFIQMERSVRLIEFFDEQGRLYRLVTTRMDLTGEEVADIYKHRWLIELFFKWIKGHLRLVKLTSTKPQGLWNQMYTAMITYALALIVRMTCNASKSTWDTLIIMHRYLEKPWNKLVQALQRGPTKASMGRQTIQNKDPGTPLLDDTVAMIKLARKRRMNKG